MSQEANIAWNIDTVFIDFTTVCNRDCPNCCCKIPSREPVHYSWSYFERVAPYIQGIHEVQITGGEPTCHPKFGEYVPKLRALFGCEVLALETNCFKAREFSDVLGCFDYIRIGEYPANRAEVEWLKVAHPHAWRQNTGFCVETADPLDENNHVSIYRRGSGQLCKLESIGRHVIYTDGRFFPCRLGLAVDGAVGVAPCAGWKERVAKIPIPCVNCYFSPDADRSTLGYPPGV